MRMIRRTPPASAARHHAVLKRSELRIQGMQTEQPICCRRSPPQRIAPAESGGVSWQMIVNPGTQCALRSAQNVKSTFRWGREAAYGCPAVNNKGYSTPRLASASSSSCASIVSRRPCPFTSSNSSKARNNRILTAAYCSASFSGRPCPWLQAATGLSGKNTLMAYVNFLSEVTSKMNSVAGASGSSAKAARFPTK